MPVDALDARILRLLLQQPRTSVREYARILGVARGTLQARLDRMEREGVITTAGPRVSPAALGHPVLAFVRIEVAQGQLDEIGARIAAVPEIIEAYSTTGGGDLLSRVVARDNTHLEDIIQRLIRLPGVVRTRTEIALRERVAERVLPLVEAVERSVEEEARVAGEGVAAQGAPLPGEQVGGHAEAGSGAQVETGAEALPGARSEAGSDAGSETQVETGAEVADDSAAEQAAPLPPAPAASHGPQPPQGPHGGPRVPAGRHESGLQRESPGQRAVR